MLVCVAKIGCWCLVILTLILGVPPRPRPRHRAIYIPSHPNRDRVINRILTQGHVGLDYLFCFWLVGLADLICLVPVFILDLLTAGIFVVGAATWVNVWSESRNKV
jgi:hypothetical protein